MRARNIKVLISLSLVIGAIVLLVVTMTTRTGYTTHYYHTTSEFLANADAYIGTNVKVNGTVMPGSVQRQDVSVERNLPRLDFVLGDSLSAIIPVTYTGTTVPDAFRETADLVVEGTYNEDGIIVARQLLVKCPSKYETTPSDADHVSQASSGS
jgi:cytochrome c-type biogenesis protein CcmE